MKKEDILKVLEESNKVFSNLTDKQINNYASKEHKELGKKTIGNNRNTESASKGGKRGGKTTANKIKNGEKIGFHLTNESLTKEELYYNRTKGAYKRKVLTKEQCDFIKNHYFKIKNQYDIIPNGKLSTSQICDELKVAKHLVIKEIKRIKNNL
jgi:hypothetical protein